MMPRQAAEDVNAMQQVIQGDAVVELARLADKEAPLLWWGCYNEGWGDVLTPESATPMPCCARNGAESSMRRGVFDKGSSAPVAGKPNAANQACHITVWAKLVTHRLGNERQTKRPDASDSSGGYSEVVILPDVRDATWYAKGAVQMLRNQVVLFLSELLGRNLDTRLIPTPVVANQRSQSNRLGEQQKVFRRDCFLPAWIQKDSEFREDGERPGMKPSAAARFSVSFVHVGSPLDRTRSRQKPTVFLLKPVALSQAMIARQMSIDRAARQTERRIAKKSAHYNLLLKLCQRDFRRRWHTAIIPHFPAKVNSLERGLLGASRRGGDALE